MRTYHLLIRGTILSTALALGSPSYAAVTNDTTFGNFNGTATISQGGMVSDNARDIAVDADGKIVLVGHVDQGPVSMAGNNFALAIARLTAGGSPDSSFSGDGKLFLSTCVASAGGPGGTSSPKVALQADGKIVVGATCLSALYEQIVVVRFNTDGTLDNSFDTDGVLYLPDAVAETGNHFGDLAVQTDGKIIVVGTRGTMNLNVRQGVILRLRSDGTPDTTFATQGKYTAADRTHFEAVALMTDGRIVAGGYTAQAGAPTTDLFVTRLTPAGAADATFGTQGVVVRNVGVLSAPLDPAFATMDFVYALAVRPDGRIVVGGSSRDSLGFPQYEPMMLQLTSSGGLDSGWGQSGFVSLGGIPGDPMVLAVYLLPDGDALLGGLRLPFTHLDSAGLARSNDSVPRSTFGIAMQNGKAVIATATPDPSFDFRAMRFAFTADSDLVPDVFGFGHNFIVPLGLQRQSDTVTITGINSSADVSVVNGEFSIACTGTFVAAGETRLIQNNATLCLRHTTSETSSTTTTSTVTVGGVSANWSTTTGDATPDGLAFASVTGAATATTVASAPATVTGINMPARLMISGGEHSVGCTGTYLSTDAQVINGQTLCLRHTSSATASTVITTTIRIGDLVTTFTSTTAAAATPPPVGGGSSSGGGSSGGGGGGGGGGGALDAWLLAALLVLASSRAAPRHRIRVR